MGMKWIYRLKKEDFAHVAQRLNVALEGRLDDMRKALSEYYSVTQNDPQLVDIWAELEATYHDGAGPSITLTNAEGGNLVASLSIDNMQNEAHRRESSPDKKTATLTPRPSQSDYAKVAKQVCEWSFRFDGAEKPFEFLEQVEWSAETFGLDLDMIPRAMLELKGFEMVYRQQQAMENLGRVHRKLSHLFSAKRFLLLASRPGPATEDRSTALPSGLLYSVQA